MECCVNALVTSFKETILAECPGMIKRNETDSEQRNSRFILIFAYEVWSSRCCNVLKCHAQFQSFT